MRICPLCRAGYPDDEELCRRDVSRLVEPGDLARIGTTIGGYHLRDIVGRGGMGIVYIGEHPRLGARAAVKVLDPRLARDRDAVERFLREARAASSIHHPNIVDVTDFGAMPDGSAYFAMEYLDGTSLEDRIERRGALPLHDGLNVANQLGLALAAAHDAGIVHCDLKPENIMLIPRRGRRQLVRRIAANLDDDGAGAMRAAGFVIEKEREYDFVKILDFGIAKVARGEGEFHAGTRGEARGSAPISADARYGTPEYMSPEAARGEEVDHRSDIYSTGVILFDMLTGRPPFEAAAAADVLAMQMNRMPPSPREIAPHLEITEAAERLIFKAMAKQPDRRHQSMAEFRDELEHCYGSVLYKRHASGLGA